MHKVLVSYWPISDWEGLPGGWRSGRKGVAGNVSARVGHSVCLYCCEKKIFDWCICRVGEACENPVRFNLFFTSQFFEFVFLILVLVRGKRFFSAAWSERGRFSCSVS